MRILTCLYMDHNYWLLALAVLVCGGGSWVALELFRRARQRSDRQRLGWLFLAAVAAGCAVWCMHFVAMLAYRNDVPATFDPFLTVASLLVAIAGAAVSFALVLNRRPTPRLATMVLAGVLLGGAVSAMHYIGMFAYKVDGLLIWSPPYVVASVLLAGLFALAAMWSEASGRSGVALVSLTLCILSLHFTGMAALEVIPSGEQLAGNSGAAGLAVAVACGVLLIVGTGAASQMIDTDVSEKALATLREMALTDGLTGLPNRNRSRSQARGCCGSSRASSTS